MGSGRGLFGVRVRGPEVGYGVLKRVWGPGVDLGSWRGFGVWKWMWDPGVSLGSWSGLWDPGVDLGFGSGFGSREGLWGPGGALGSRSKLWDPGVDLGSRSGFRIQDLDKETFGDGQEKELLQAVVYPRMKLPKWCCAGPHCPAWRGEMSSPGVNVVPIYSRTS